MLRGLRIDLILHFLCIAATCKPLFFQSFSLPRWSNERDKQIFTSVHILVILYSVQIEMYELILGKRSAVPARLVNTALLDPSELSVSRALYVCVCMCVLYVLYVYIYIYT